MDLDKRLEIYKAEYYFQVDFKEKLYARMAIYAVLITACITANVTMFDTLIKSTEIYLIFAIFLWEILACVLIFILYGFYCVSHIKVDNWINTNSDMENYRNIIALHYDEHTKPSRLKLLLSNNRKKYIDEQFQLYLVEQYSSCSTIIRDNNVYRQRWLSRIMSGTYLLLLITAILGILYLINKI